MAGLDNRQNEQTSLHRTWWQRLWSSREPHWLIRDVVLVVLIGVGFASTQTLVDNHRGDQNERLENLRFVRKNTTALGARALSFRSIDLKGMNLSGLVIAEGDFRSADLSKSKSHGLLVIRGQFETADLREAALNYANLSASTFYHTNAEGADFSNALLINADLRFSDFHGANFFEAVIINTDFEGSDLSGAINLNSESMGDICYSDDTKWPAGFEPPARSNPSECGPKGYR